MTAKELLKHPSIQREFSRFRNIGGDISITGNKVALSAISIVPDNVVKSFAKRIKRLDKNDLLQINIEQPAD